MLESEFLSVFSFSYWHCLHAEKNWHPQIATLMFMYNMCSGQWNSARWSSVQSSPGRDLLFFHSCYRRETSAVLFCRYAKIHVLRMQSPRGVSPSPPQSHETLRPGWDMVGTELLGVCELLSALSQGPGGRRRNPLRESATFSPLLLWHMCVCHLIERSAL